MPRYLKFAMMAMTLLTLMGCKEVLYSDLSENDANRMVAVLAVAGVQADRDRMKDGNFSILVEKDNIAIATVVLSEAGLPEARFQTLGDVFSASGIIGTPFEQHARYIHAMNQELSGVLSEIEGVVTARVIVNAPPAARHQRDQPRATASVTVHHEPDFAIEAHVAKIKLIISHALPDLAYQDVTTAFFPTNGIQLPTPADTLISEGLEVSKASILPTITIGSRELRPAELMLLIASALVSICVMMLLRFIGKRGLRPGPTTQAPGQPRVPKMPDGASQ